MNEKRSKKILCALGDIDSDFVLDAAPEVGYTKKRKRGSAIIKFLNSTAGVAIICTVISLGAVVGIVMAGQNSPTPLGNPTGSFEGDSLYEIESPDTLEPDVDGTQVPGASDETEQTTGENNADQTTGEDNEEKYYEVLVCSHYDSAYGVKMPYEYDEDSCTVTDKAVTEKFDKDELQKCIDVWVAERYANSVYNANASIIEVKPEMRITPDGENAAVCEVGIAYWYAPPTEGDEEIIVPAVSMYAEIRLIVIEREFEPEMGLEDRVAQTEKNLAKLADLIQEALGLEYFSVQSIRVTSCYCEEHDSYLIISGRGLEPLPGDDLDDRDDARSYTWNIDYDGFLSLYKINGSYTVFDATLDGSFFDDLAYAKVSRVMMSGELQDNTAKGPVTVISNGQSVDPYGFLVFVEEAYGTTPEGENIDLVGDGPGAMGYINGDFELAEGEEIPVLFCYGETDIIYPQIRVEGEYEVSVYSMDGEELQIGDEDMIFDEKFNSLTSLPTGEYYVSISIYETSPKGRCLTDYLFILRMIRS